jgi:hypothetical protein
MLRYADIEIYVDRQTGRIIAYRTDLPATTTAIRRITYDIGEHVSLDKVRGDFEHYEQTHGTRSNP